jgi:indolepyruvate ferredoxin oxidoreductase beta subunit
MLGVAIKKALLPFSQEEVLQTISENLPAKFMEINKKALEIGYNFQQYL